MRHMGARMTTTRSRCQGWVGGGGRVGEGGHVGGRRPGEGQRMGRGGKSGRGREDGSKLPGHEQCPRRPPTNARRTKLRRSI